MKNTQHTTNYFNTFIAVAPDCKAHEGTVPPKKEPPTQAQLQFEKLKQEPYAHTSDDVLFMVWAQRGALPPETYAQAREEFFSKGQPCLRSSPLCKTYGWGVHHDAQGKVAIYALDSPEYAAFLHDASLQQVKAMRSTRA